jgi:hypothetical protein
MKGWKERNFSKKSYLSNVLPPICYPPFFHDIAQTEDMDRDLGHEP